MRLHDLLQGQLYFFFIFYDILSWSTGILDSSWNSYQIRSRNVRIAFKCFKFLKCNLEAVVSNLGRISKYSQRHFIFKANSATVPCNNLRPLCLKSFSIHIHYPFHQSTLHSWVIAIVVKQRQSKTWRYTEEWRYTSTVLELVTRWRLVVSFTPLLPHPQGNSPRYPLGRSLYGHQIWSGRCEIILHCRKSNPDIPTRSLSLYRLSYPDFLRR
jgi:hypothetical protein